MAGLPSAYKQLRTELSRQYELVRWVVFLFIGGSFDSISILLYGNFFEWYGRIPTPTQQDQVTSIIVIILASALLFVIPILLSLSLSRLLPSRQLMPPFYMNIIATAFILNVVYAQYLNPANRSLILFSLYPLLLYILLGGLTQDRIVAGIMGRGAVRDDIIGRSFLVSANIDSMKKIISTEQYARRININRNSYETKKGGIVFPPVGRGRGYNITIELIKKGDNMTLVNVCVWNALRYNFVRDADLEEYASDKLAYLADLLQHPRVEERREGFTLASAVSTDLADLVDRILDEAGGLVVHTERISVIGWIQLIVFLLMAGGGFGLLYIGGQEATLAGIGALVSIGVYIVFALPERFGRGGMRHI